MGIRLFVYTLLAPLSILVGLLRVYCILGCVDLNVGMSHFVSENNEKATNAFRTRKIRIPSIFIYKLLLTSGELYL
jgi:hypothetical protein